MPRTAIVSLTTLLAFSCVCSAQMYSGPGDAPIVGSGTASQRAPASRLRAFIPLTAQGKGVRQAAEAIQEKIKAARLQLATLGADKESIKVGTLRINTGATDMHHQMRQQSRGLYLSGESADEQSKDANDTVMVQQHLIADWPLSGDEIELLTASHELRRAIMEAGFNTSADEESSLSAEEQELVEEAQMFGESDDEKSDEPAIVFVATIKKEERVALMKKAIADAHRSAGMIAEASGIQLGKLVQIRESGKNSAGFGDQYELMELFGRQNATTIMASMQNSDEANSTAIGKDPTELSFSVSMSIGFEISEE